MSVTPPTCRRRAERHRVDQATRLRLESLEERTLLAVDLQGVPVWVEQGPGPIIDNRFGGLPAMGAVQALATHPYDSDVLFAGTVNGGVWRTLNATDSTPSWRPLTDQLPSLTTGAIALSPLDQDGQPFNADTPLDKIVLYGGIGSFTHSAYKGLGLTGGVLKSIDGGDHWSLLGHADLDGLRVTSVVPTTIIDSGTGPGRGGQVVLISTDTVVFESGPVKTVRGGVFISRDGGRTLRQISGDRIDDDRDAMIDESDEGHLLPAGPVSHLIADVSDPGQFALYAAVAGDFDNKKLGGNDDATDNDLIPWSHKGIYRSDNGGQRWDTVASAKVPAPSGIEQMDRALKIKLAVHESSGIVYAGIVSEFFDSMGDSQGKQLAGLIRSDNKGGQWTSIPLPSSNDGGVTHGLIPGGQGDFSITVSRSDPNEVYTAGDRQEDPLSGNAAGCRNYVGRVFRGNFAGGSWEQIVCNGASGTATHADTRDMVMDASGELLQSDDGGIYRFESGGLIVPFLGGRFVHDGATITVDGTVFELDSGPSLLLGTFSTSARDRLDDGDTLTITDQSGVNAPVTFEFEDTNVGNGVKPGNVAIPFQGTLSNDEPATNAIAAAINGVPRSGFEVTATVLGCCTISLTGDSSLVDSTHQEGEPPLVIGKHDVESGHVAIRFEETYDTTRLGTHIVTAVNNANVGTTARVAMDGPGRIAFTGSPAISVTSPFEVRPFWLPAIGDLRISEMYSVAYDHLNHVIFAGMQDTGSAEQRPGANDGIDNDDNGQTDEPLERFPWTAITLGDGNTQGAAVVDISGDGIDNDFDGLIDGADASEFGTRALRFTLGNDLSEWYRNEFDATGKLANRPNELGVTRRPLDDVSKQQSLLVEGNCYGKDDNTSFYPFPYVINAVQPPRLLAGANGLYESPDGGNHYRLIQSATDCSLADVTALAYGGREPNSATPDPTDTIDAPDVIYAARGTEIYVRSKAGEAFIGHSIPGAAKVRSIALDPSNWRIAYAIDQASVYMTTDAGATWSSIGASLTDLMDRSFGGTDHRDVVLVKTPNHDVLLVGGLGGVYRAIDPGAGAEPIWTKLGANFPNVLVSSLLYSQPDDVLVAGTVGRGAWSLPQAKDMLAAAGTLTIHADPSVAQPDTRLARNGDNPMLLDVYVNHALGRSIPLAVVQSIHVVGSNLDDTLTIDSTHGVVHVPLGIRFDGGGGSQNAVVLEGAASACQRRNDGPDAGGVGLSQISGPSPVSGDVEVQTVRFVRAQRGPAPLDNAMACLRDGQQGISDLALNQPTLIAHHLPLIGDSLGRALDGVSLASLQARIDPVPGAAKALDGEVGSSSHLLRRLFETGLGAIDLADIGSSSATPNDLREALDALDDAPNNVSLTQADGVTRFDVQVNKSLSGKADLHIDTEVLGGNIRLDGTAEISADVSLQIAFGVDSQGFFIDADRQAAPEVVVSNIRLSGDVRGAGRFGFLAVNLVDGRLAVDPGVKLSVDLREPGPDPFTNRTDGLIRSYELDGAAIDLASAQLGGNPAANDVVFTGTLNVAAVLPGLPAPFELVDAQIAFQWADIANTDAVEVVANTSTGQALFDFLHVTPDQVVEGLNKTGEFLDQVRQNPAVLGTKIPFTRGTTIGEVVDVADAFRKKVTALVQSSEGTTTITTVQDLAYQLSVSLGLDPSALGWSYDPDAHDLTYNLELLHDFEPVSVPVGFDLHAGTFAGFQTSSSASLAAQLGMQLSFGMNLQSAMIDETLSDSFFLKDPLLTGQVTVTADDINAVARIGSLGMQVHQGSASGMGSISVPLVDPGSQSADGKISLRELETAVNDISSILGNVTTTLSGGFNLPVTADPLTLGDITVALEGSVSGTVDEIDYSLTAAIAGTIVSGLAIEQLPSGEPSHVTLTRADGLEIHARANAFGVRVILDGAIQATDDFSLTALADPFDIGGTPVALSGNLSRRAGEINWDLTGTVTNWRPVPFLTIDTLEVTLDANGLELATTATIAGVSGVHLAGDYHFNDSTYLLMADVPLDWTPVSQVDLTNVRFSVTNRTTEHTLGPVQIEATADLRLFDTDFGVTAHVTDAGQWLAATPANDHWKPVPIPGFSIDQPFLVASNYEFVLDVPELIEVMSPPVPLAVEQRQIFAGINLLGSGVLPQNVPGVGGSTVQIAGRLPADLDLAKLSIDAKLVLEDPPEIAGLLALDAVGLRVTGAPSIAVFGQGRILHEPVPGLDQDVAVEVALSIDIPGTTLSGSLSLLKPIEDVFGVEGLNVIEGDGEFGVNFATTPLPLPTVGFNLLVELPADVQDTMGLPSEIAAALNISSTQPILAMSVLDWRPFQALGVDEIVIDQGSLVVAPNGGTIGTKVFARGFSATFDAEIFGSDVSFVGIFDQATRGFVLKSTVSSTRIAGIDIGGAGCDRMYQDGVDNSAPGQIDPDADNGACFIVTMTATAPQTNGFTVDFTVDLPGSGGLVEVRGELTETSLVLDGRVEAWNPLPTVELSGEIHAVAALQTPNLELDFDVSGEILGAMTQFVGSVSASPTGFALFATGTIGWAFPGGASFVDLAATIDLGKNSPFLIEVAADLTLPGTRPADLLLAGTISSSGVGASAVVENWQLVPGLSFEGTVDVAANVSGAQLLVGVDVDANLIGSNLNLQGQLYAGAGGLDLDLLGQVHFGGARVGGVSLDLDVHLETKSVGSSKQYNLGFEGELDLFAGFSMDVTAELSAADGGFVLTAEVGQDVSLPNIRVGPLTVELTAELSGTLSFGTRLDDFAFGVRFDGKGCVVVDRLGRVCTPTLSAELGFDGADIVFPKIRPEVQYNDFGIPTGVDWKKLKKPAPNPAPPAVTVTARRVGPSTKGGTSILEIRGGSRAEQVEVVRHVCLVTAPCGDNLIVRATNTAGDWVQLLTTPTAGLGLLDVDMRGGNDSFHISGFPVLIPTVLRGGTGRDVIHGGAGPNTIYGGSGTGDTSSNLKPFPRPVFGQDRGDQLLGGPDNDLILGEAGDDIIVGGGGNDVIHGGTGINIVNGTLEFSGTARPDRLEVSQLPRSAKSCGFSFFPPCDTDLVVRSGHGVGPLVTLLRTPLDGLSAISVNGLAGNDTITVAPQIALPTALRGGPGQDAIQGGGGQDMIFGDEGDDELFGGAGNDTIDCGPGRDSVISSAGTDLIDTASCEETIVGADSTSSIGQPGKNHPPVVDPIVDTSVDEGVLLTFTATATDRGNEAAFFGPAPYLSRDDSPFAESAFSYFYLEDFEDSQLDVPGVVASEGTIFSSLPARPANTVSWWRADGNAQDSVGRNHGALRNGASFAAGRIGRAFQFDGANHYLEVPSSPGLEMTSGLTVEAWINLSTVPETNPSGQTIVAKGVDAESPVDWAFAVNGSYGAGKLRPHIQLNNGNWVFFDCNTTPVVGQWYHVAMTYDGSSLRCYVDGELDGSLSVAGTLRPSSGPLRIGAYAPLRGSFSKHFFHGSIDELAIYDRALTVTELRTIAHGAAPPLIMGQLPDSVDGDDGLIDGSGTEGHSFVTQSTGRVAFTFDPVALGALPTHAGIVWTDGVPGSVVAFEAFDENGQSLGVVDRSIGDSSQSGTTVEDRFFGVTYTAGISHIELRSASGAPMEIDHLQYGRLDRPNLTFRLDSGAPAGASIDPTSGVFSWSPTETQGPAEYTITVRSTDDGVPPLADSETFTITVNEVNSPPRLATMAGQSVEQGKPLKLRFRATDPDVPSNQLSFRLDGAPGGATIDPESGAFHWRPDQNQGPGVYSITVRVADDRVPPLDDSLTIAVTVLPDDTAPTIEDLALITDATGITRILLAASEAMERATVTSRSQYRLTELGSDNRLGTADDRSIAIASANYAASTNVIEITPQQALRLNRLYQLVIETGPDPLGGGGMRDLHGSVLDGDLDGRSGGDYEVQFVHGTEFSFLDHDADAITLMLSGGGVMQLIQSAGGQPHQLRLRDTGIDETVLSGTLTPSRAGDQRTTLNVHGLRRVENRLSDPPFVLRHATDNEWTFLGAVQWKSNSSGTWNDPNNWSTGRVPGPDDIVVIDQPGLNVVVTTPARPVAVGSLILRDTLLLSGELTGAMVNVDGGTLSGTGTIIGDVRNAGIIRPGLSPGTLTINGNYTQTADGVLELEVGGITPSVNHDQLLVRGAANLDGTLTVTFVNGFVPVSGNRFDVLGAASIRGAFAVVNSNTTGGGKPLTVNPDGSLAVGALVGDLNRDEVVNAADIDRLFTAVLGGESALSLDVDSSGTVDQRDIDHLVQVILGTFYGDAHLDGAVDFADFLALSTHFGGSDSGWADGDFDGDRSVGFRDFLILSNSFGITRRQPR